MKRRSRQFAIVAAAGLFAAACGGSESSDSAASEPDAGEFVIVDAAPEADPGDIVVVEDAAPQAETNTDADAAASDAGDDSGADIVVSTEGADPESTSDVSEEALALQFAQCMRDEGIDSWPDPVANADGSIDITGGGVVGPGPASEVAFGSDEVQAVIPICGPIIAGASFLPNSGEGMTTETEDQLLAFAQCLRDEGIDVSDPDLSDGVAGLLDWEFDPEDPANADAIGACQTLFAGAGGG
ncbi:MAG: hypothetical protein QNM02_19020 [Acidimicrobiia bacterium]|nr:hypothetical protein [Acidimicrobiia bacterium]